MTLNLGKILGIHVRIHWSFWLLPVYVYFSMVLAGSGFTSAATTVLLILAVFGCVLLHEFGHALAARQFGIPTRDITLLPIGGVAMLEHMPRSPLQELWIAVAGPLVNVVIATVLFAGATLSGVGFGTEAGGFVQQLIFANVALVAFNMLPAFPMDGGRVFRSLLAVFLNYKLATRIAAGTGKVAAVALGLFGLLNGNIMMAFLAAFVFFAAQSELAAVTSDFDDGSPPPQRGGSRGRTFGMFSGNRDRDQMNDVVTRQCDVPSTLSAESVASWLNEMRADACRVIEAGRVIGVITRTRLISELSRGMGRMPVGALVR